MGVYLPKPLGCAKPNQGRVTRSNWPDKELCSPTAWWMRSACRRKSGSKVQTMMPAWVRVRTMQGSPPQTPGRLSMPGKASPRSRDRKAVIVFQGQRLKEGGVSIARQPHVPLVKRLPRAPEQALQFGRKVVVRIIGATEPPDTIYATPVAECCSEPCIE